MKTAFRLGVLCAAFAIHFISVAAAEEPAPWLGRWVQAKLKRGITLTDLYRAIEAATRPMEPKHDRLRDIHAIDIALPQPPLEELIGDKSVLGSEAAKLYLDRGRVRVQKRQYREAIRDFDEGLRRDSASVNGLVMRGHARAMLGQYGKAILDFDRAIALQPRRADGYLRRGHCQLSKGDRDGALQDFEQYVQCDPQAAAFANLAMARIACGKYEQAIKDLDRARELDPKNLDVLRWRALARFCHSDYAWAIEDLDYALALNSKPSADAYFIRALAWSRLGQTAKAHSDLNEAGRLNPNVLQLTAPVLFDQARTVHIAVCSKKLQWELDVTLRQRSSRRSALATAAQAPQTTATQAIEATPGDFNAGAFAKKTFDANRFAPELKNSGSGAPPQPSDSNGATAPPAARADIGPRVLAPWLDPADEQRAQTLVAQAWILATSRYEDRRDGARAVELARQACEITEWRAFGCLETLAAAYAECGDFESADKHQTRAVELAAADKEGRRAASKRLTLFRERRPLHTVR